MHGAVLAIIVVYLLYRFIKWLVEIPARRRREALMRTVALSGVDGMTGREFEEYVLQVLQHQGYLCTLTPASGDMGVDIVAVNGSNKLAVQCKRQTRHVSRRAVADVAAGKVHYGCEGAAVVTNSWFTPSACRLARSTRTALVDRETFAAWIEHFQAKG
jgi:restriction system protein